MPLAPTPGLRAVPSRSTTDALVRAGVVLLLVGWLWPWLGEGDHCDRPRFRELSWILEEVRDGLAPPASNVEWWWSLPLAYGLALPALWCRHYRHRTGPRLAAAWACLVVLLGVLAWSCASAPLDWANVRSEARCCPERSFAWALQPLQPSEGFYITAVGALLVGLGPMLALQRLRGLLARWRARPARAALPPAGGGSSLPRLSYSLRRLVDDARELRGHLSPFEPLDGVPERMLVDIVGCLRALDDQGRAELRDHGLCARALLEALAPVEPRRESGLDEVLRLDAALARLEAVGQPKDTAAPYR